MLGQKLRWQVREGGICVAHWLTSLVVFQSVDLFCSTLIVRVSMFPLILELPRALWNHFHIPYYYRGSGDSLSMRPP